MMIIFAKFQQPSSFIGMGGKNGHVTSPHFPMIPIKKKRTIMKILNFPRRSAREALFCQPRVKGLKWWCQGSNPRPSDSFSDAIHQ